MAPEAFKRCTTQRRDKGMTKQIGQAYRRNKRGSLLLVAAVVALAVIAIPIASGAADKNYTLGFAAATSASPSPPLTRADLCTGTSGQQVTLYLTNTAKTVSLGSAKITLPSYATGASAFKNTTDTPVTGPTNFTFVAATATSAPVVFAQNLGLAKWGYLKLVVDVNPTTPSPAGGDSVTAVVKQSNMFNDAGGDANLFTNPAFPTLNAKNCYGTISGHIWKDTVDDGSHGALALEPFQSLKIAVYQKQSGGSYTPYPDAGHVPVDTDGTYTVSSVQLGREYLVCERDASAGWTQATWAQTIPVASTAFGSVTVGDTTHCETQSVANETNGYTLNFTASVDNVDFGNVPAVTPSCAGTFQGASTDGTFEYKARLGLVNGHCKDSALVMETFRQTPSSLVATLHPIGNPGTTCPGGANCFPVVERIRWTGLGTPQNPITLHYDDTYPYDGNGAPVMLMCLSDPRVTPNAPIDDDRFTLKTSLTGVLPTAVDTSCMIVSTDSAGGSYEAWIYSSVDGWKGGG
jgi:hypothetical protein